MENDQNLHDTPSTRSWKALFPSLSIKVILVSLLFLAALLCFALLTHQVVFGNEKAFDDRVFLLISRSSDDEVIQFMKHMTFFGSSAFLFPAYIILVAYLLKKGEKRMSINIAIIAASGWGMLHLLKRVFRRERPELPLLDSLSTYSFPSGHALSSFIFSMIVMHVLWKTNLQNGWKWIGSIMLLLFAFTVGISRIFLKMHFASDVIAGFCLGLVWVLVSFRLMKMIEKKEDALKLNK